MKGFIKAIFHKNYFHEEIMSPCNRNDELLLRVLTHSVVLAIVIFEMFRQKLSPLRVCIQKPVQQLDANTFHS